MEGASDPNEQAPVDKPAVPKFGSFKPKPRPREILETRDPRESLHERDDDHERSGHERSRHERSGHERSRHGKRRHHKRHSASALSESSQGRSARPSPAPSSQPILISDTQSGLFFIDKKGDPDNVTYGASHRYGIPAYSRFGAGRVLGLPGNERIVREESNDKQTVLRDHEAGRSSRSSHTTWPTVKPGNELPIRPAEDASAVDVGANFVPLHPQKRRNIGGTISGSDESDSDGHYRSIEGKAGSDSRSRELGPVKTQAPPEQSEARRRGVELSRLVEKEPLSGQAWLDLINHQDVEQAERQIGVMPTLAERHSLAEIKMSMASRALQKVQDSHHRELLTVASMQAAAEVSDDRAQLHAKWHKTLKENPGMTKLWVPYLNSLQTTSTSFQFEDLRDAFSNCLQDLKSAREIGQADSRIEVYLLLRMTVCIRQAGYVEQAVAIWQALLDFNFFRPPGLSGAEAIESFEEYWESETSRIGEEYARGWAACTTNNASKQPETREISGLTERPAPHNSSGVRTWFAVESEVASHARTPARSLDARSSEDAYRVVLFSDIKDFVLEIMPPDQELLVHAFLAFCTLPPLQSAPSDVLAWWKDPFVTGSTHSNDRPRSGAVGNVQTRSFEDATEEGEQDQTDSIFSFRSMKFAVSLDTLFQNGQSWCPAIGISRALEPKGMCDLSTNWILKALRILADSDIGGEELAEALLATELHCSPLTVKKTAKALLKRQPSGLRLYNAYALIEYRLGNLTAGDNVLETATKMSSAKPACALLWRTWVMEALFTGRQQEGLARLLGMTNVTRDGSLDLTAHELHSEIFQAQQSLMASRDQSLRGHDFDSALLFMECLVALSYCSNPDPLEAALSVSRSNLLVLPTDSPLALRSRELFQQSCARLCFHHATTQRRYRPSLIREFLVDCLGRFPDNTILLCLFTWSEARFRIDDRVRAAVHTHLQSLTSVVDNHQQHGTLLLFAVQVELTRAASLGSSVYSIRSAFERATGCHALEHSVLLWKWYFDFEMNRGEIKRAQNVYYRAIRACPWAKELYALPFMDLHNSTSTEELQECYQLMLDRELRVHVTLHRQ